MRILGLTGGIAMGKSTVAALFRRRHVPVFDADRVVHALQAPGGAAIAPIAAAFPGCVHHGQLDRAALRHAVLGDPDRLRRLESIMHPLVRTEMTRFIARHRRARAPLVVLEIPLLLESGLQRHMDAVLAVTAPRALQRQRLRRRGTFTPAQIDSVLARQMPDAERRRRADLLIRTGLSRHHAARQVSRLIARLP